MGKSILYFFTLMYLSCATSHSSETTICIKNKSKYTKHIYVKDVDNYDWERERPDHNFNGVAISPGDRICRREDTNSNSSPSFSFEVNNQKTRMKYLSGSWVTVQNIDKPDSLYGLRDSRNVDRYRLGSHLPGGICRDGARCSEFEIREHLLSPRLWMSGLDDGVRIDQITIPGTHDSAAYKIEYVSFNPFNPIAAAKALAQYAGPDSLSWLSRTDYSKAIQTSPKMDVLGQLNSGVRFLDLRGRRNGGACLLHHGGYYLDQTCGQFLGKIYKFLDDNPSETVILSVKAEYDPVKGSKEIEEIIKNYIYKAGGGAYKKYWYVGSEIPSLGVNTKSINNNVEYQGSNIRGRIVLLRRFGLRQDTVNPNFGISGLGWPDDDWGYTDDKNIFVQDEYKNILANNKWDMIDKTMLRRQNEPGRWFINFTSAYYGGNTPYDFAMNINFRVKDKLRGEAGNYGTIVMDFITPEISEIIYSTNFGGWAKPD